MAKSKTLAALGLVSEVAEGEAVIDLDVTLCDPNPYQPRVDLGDLEELAGSLVHRQFHAITVRKKGDRYEVADGWRRLSAMTQILNRPTIRAVVQEYTDAEMAIQAVVTALDRKTLNPIEEMRAFKDWKNKFGWSYKQIAKYANRSLDYVNNRMRAARWPEDLVELVEAGQLDFWMAVELAAIRPDALRSEMTEITLTDSLTVKALRERVQVAEAVGRFWALEADAKAKLRDKAVHGTLTLEAAERAEEKAQIKLIPKPAEGTLEPQEEARGFHDDQGSQEPEETVYGRVRRLVGILTPEELGLMAEFGEGLLQKRSDSGMLTSLPNGG